MTSKRNKMAVEVWSDVMCPYCYLGKRMLQKALADFPHRNEVEIVWRSFQLMPDLQTDTTIDIYQLLARKGFAPQAVKQMNERLEKNGEREGIVFNFDRIVVANSFNAHRMMHFARESGKQNEAQEKVFSAYFTEGRNVDDPTTLIALGEEIGLDTAALSTVLNSGAYGDAVRADMEEARRLEIQSVPHFLFDRDHAVSGAEGSAIFLRTLEKAFEAWKKRSAAE